MPNEILTERFVAALDTPELGQKSYLDSPPGFGVPGSQAGSKTFILKHNNRSITIGRFPLLSLADACIEAKRLLAEFTLGKASTAMTYNEALECCIRLRC